MESSISSTLPSGKMFLATSSQIHERYDPYYIFHKLNTSLESKYRSERLSSLVNTFSGGTPSKSNPSYWDGDIPWISPKDFNGFNLFETEDKITEEGVKNSSTKVAPKNSIVIVVRSGVLAHTFPVCINRVPAAINQDLKVLTPTTEELLPEFLGYYFFTFGEKLLPLVTKHGTTVHSINTEQFERLQIPVPPIHIQEKVISIYQEHFETKAQKEAKAEQLLKSIDEYLLNELGITIPEEDNSLTNRIFTTSFQNIAGSRFDPKFLHYDKINVGNKFPVINLKELVTINKGQSLTSKEVEDGPYPVIAGGQSSPYTHNEFTHSGNIITVSASGAYAGYVWYHSSPIFATDCSVINSDNESRCLTEFIYWVLKSIQQELYKLQQGAAQPHVYPDDLKNIEIPLPELEKQEKILAQVRMKKQAAEGLRKEAKQSVEEARRQVEEMILEEDSVAV